MNEENKHINLSIGCPKIKHGDFYIDEEKGNFVCNGCGEYFTDEVKKIFEALKQTLEK